MDPYSSRLFPPGLEHAIGAGTAAIPAPRDTAAPRVFRILLLLSVLLHALVLGLLPPLRFAQPPAGDPDNPLAVELRRLQPPPGDIPQAARPAPRSDAVPPPAAASPSTTPAPPAPPRAPAPKRVAPPAPPPAPRFEPVPDAVPVPAQPEPPAAERAQPPRSTDLASYIEARRRARGATGPAAPSAPSEPAKAADDETARSNRIVASNLGLGRTPTFGEARDGGGIFHITRINYGSAEFLFFGWNKDIRRNTSQLIEVRKGEHSDIRLAVVRRMIAIVREHESGDFRWESRRLGRDVMLSARPIDNAGLEDFLMREFFDDPRQP